MRRHSHNSRTWNGDDAMPHESEAVEVKEYTCVGPGCGEKVSASAYEFEDLEFDEDNPLCISCAREEELKGKTCEYCNREATEMVELGPLCDKHYDEYADGASLQY